MTLNDKDRKLVDIGIKSIVDVGVHIGMTMVITMVDGGLDAQQVKKACKDFLEEECK